MHLYAGFQETQKATWDFWFCAGNRNVKGLMLPVAMALCLVQSSQQPPYFWGISSFLGLAASFTAEGKIPPLTNIIQSPFLHFNLPVRPSPWNTNGLLLLYATKQVPGRPSRLWGDQPDGTESPVSLRHVSLCLKNNCSSAHKLADFLTHGCFLNV